MVFLAAENENQQLRDLPQTDFGRVHENISFDVRKKSTTESFVKRKLRPLSIIIILSISQYTLWRIVFPNSQSKFALKKFKLILVAISALKYRKFYRKYRKRLKYTTPKERTSRGGV